MKTPRVQDFDPTAKVPQLGSPMDNLPSIQKPPDKPHPSLTITNTKPEVPIEIARKPVSTQTGLHANVQTSKDASMQARIPVNLQEGKQVNLQTGKQVIIEKYSSYLTHEYKRELKRIAFESDRSEYEVLLEAVEQYLEKQKPSR